MQSEQTSRTPRVLADFEGRWKITRSIVPKRGPNGRFEGLGLWSADGDGLAYRETGTLFLDGAPPMQAERRYRWAPDLSVYFDDGRFFHRVPAAGGRTQHWCDPDTYTVEYEFADWPTFSVTWQVQGPRKSYEMTSLYTPEA